MNFKCLEDVLSTRRNTNRQIIISRLIFILLFALYICEFGFYYYQKYLYQKINIFTQSLVLLLSQLFLTHLQRKIIVIIFAFILLLFYNQQPQINHQLIKIAQVFNWNQEFNISHMSLSLFNWIQKLNHQKEIIILIKIIITSLLLPIFKTRQLPKLNKFLIDEQYYKYIDAPELYIIEKMNQIQYYKKISKNVIQSFFTQINQHYNPVPYHNITHGFDVTVKLDSFLNEKLKNAICKKDGIDYICMLIAGYAHDCGHMGYTNQYYKQSDHDLAIIYSYQSPLENMHSSILMRICKKYPKIIPKQNRKDVIRMILATDLEKSSHQTDKIIKQAGNLRHMSSYSEQTKSFVKQILIHAADVGNPTKNTAMWLKWGQKITEQFENQKKIKLKTEVATELKLINKQLHFLKQIVLPLYQGLNDCFQSFSVFLKQIKINIEYHENQNQNQRKQLQQNLSR